MSGFLRVIGIINAAIWFGAGIVFTVAVLPAVFSQDMRDLLHEAAYPYFSGSVAVILFKRFFILQYVCGAVAVAHLLAEKLYLGRALPRFGTALVLTLLALGLIGGLGLQPRMESLRQTKYFGATQPQREQAGKSFALWHGLSQCANLLVIGGLLAHLVRVTRPVGPARYGNFYQIP